MFGSEVLEIAAGMVFLFAFISLICTAIKEWLEGIFKWRALDLERALRNLLDDPNGNELASLMKHPLLQSLFQGKYDPADLRDSPLTPGQDAKHIRLSQRRHLPSYIPSSHFALAFLDRVARGPVDPSAGPRDPVPDSDATLSVSALLNGLPALPSEHLRRAVLSACDISGGKLEQVQASLEQWFNGAMDRASGWYKRRTQAVLFLIGLAVAVTMNVDSLYIMHRLTFDKAFREVVLKEAEKEKPNGTTPSERIASARNTLELADMPVGWRPFTCEGAKESCAQFGSITWVPRQVCKSPGQAQTCVANEAWSPIDWVHTFSGWLITAFAVMLGSPFWFDVLNKIMVIRSTVKPHEKSREEASEDRQA